MNKVVLASLFSYRNNQSISLATLVEPIPMTNMVNTFSFNANLCILETLATQMYVVRNVTNFVSFTIMLEITIHSIQRGLCLLPKAV